MANAKGLPIQARTSSKLARPRLRPEGWKDLKGREAELRSASDKFSGHCLALISVAGQLSELLLEESRTAKSQPLPVTCPSQPRCADINTVFAAPTERTPSKQRF
jgi:hypothetical protein